MNKGTVIGHLAQGEQCFDGQTVKTRIITEELQAYFGKEQILESDTHGGRKKMLKVPILIFKALKKSENMIIFPAQNGLRVYVPLLSFWNIFFKRKLQYVVIGGWLPNFLKKRKLLKKLLKQFRGIYVETTSMKTALREQGFENVYVMPNCKKLTILSEEELVYSKNKPYKLCTFSRVSKEKGIEDAVNAIKAVNRELGYRAYSLDIYGKIDAGETEWFENLQKKFPDFIRYGGLVPFDRSVDVLKDYYALLFPTYYRGEGFAGTLLDSFSAGVPVIATDWRYNAEIVNQDVGFLYPTGDLDALIKILKAVAENPSMIYKKKRTCLREAKKYKPNRVIETIVNNM